MQNQKNLISNIIKVLCEDQVIAIGTDTVYALVGNAYSSAVVERIYHLKQRELSKPMAICLKDVEQINNFVKEIPSALYPIINRWMPGPLTVLLRAKTSSLSPLLTQYYLGIRIPAISLFSQILNNIQFPLVATSANPSGCTEAYTAKQVRDYFSKKELPYLWDSGKSSLQMPSTVISLENNICTVHRIGPISIAELKRDLPPDCIIVRI